MESHGEWKMSDEVSAIYKQSTDHKDGKCTVDRRWFPAPHLASLLEQYPDQPDPKSIRIPEKVKIETETTINTYEFRKESIPNHFAFLKSLHAKLILFRREK